MLQRLQLLLLCLLAGILTSCDDGQNIPASGVSRIVSSEELILDLTNRLRPMGRAARDLSITDETAPDLFDPTCIAADLSSARDNERVTPSVDRATWQIGDAAALSDDGLFSAFLGSVDSLDWARFYVIDGAFEDETSRFVTTIGFAAHGRSSSGDRVSATAKSQVSWSDPEGARDAMRIVAWKTKSFETTHSRDLLFQDVTASRVVDPALADALSGSVHQDLNRLMMRGEAVDLPNAVRYPYFFPEVTLEHPSVAVVDLNGDGSDDFFLGRPYQPALFFENDGRGRFREISASIGLDLPADCTAALFGDYDNDGDQDLFIGRARNRALYFENADGRFRDATALRVRGSLPYMVSSISAADVNQDGLLDVYFSTYSPNEGQLGVSNTSASKWPSLFLDGDERREFERRRTGSHAFLASAGPPNLLLENTGGGFAPSSHNASVQSWRKSFQSAFADYDNDGDADLYVCNDFGPDDLYRNDGEAGFTRVNDEAGLDALGFGMGVTWGDHNNDGLLDIYVSNMFSKAGRRITAQVEGIDPSFRKMAMGNYLYEATGDGTFELVSLGGSQPAVSKSGWSWGGQFTDIDNDGWLDLCVASGYYSAPPEVAIEVDL